MEVAVVGHLKAQEFPVYLRYILLSQDVTDNAKEVYIDNLIYIYIYQRIIISELRE